MKKILSKFLIIFFIIVGISFIIVALFNFLKNSQYEHNSLELPRWKKGDQRYLGEWNLHQFKVKAYIDYYISGGSLEYPCYIKSKNNFWTEVELTQESKMVNSTGKIRIVIENSEKEINNVSIKFLSSNFEIYNPNRVIDNILPGEIKSIEWDVFIKKGSEPELIFDIETNKIVEKINVPLEIISENRSNPVGGGEKYKNPQIIFSPFKFTVPSGNNKININFTNVECYPISYDFDLVPAFLPNHFPNHPKINYPSVQHVDFRGGETKEIKWEINASDYGEYFYNIESLAGEVLMMKPYSEKSMGVNNEIMVYVMPEDEHKIDITIDNTKNGSSLKRTASKPGEQLKYDLQLKNMSNDIDEIAMFFYSSGDGFPGNGNGWSFYLLEDGNLNKVRERTISIKPNSSYNFTLILIPTNSNDISEHYEVKVFARSEIFYAKTELIISADVGW